MSVPEGTRVYSELRAKVVAAGILDPSYTYYLPLIGLTFSGYVASVGAIYNLDNYWLLAVTCFCFSFFSVQIAGLMHDSGHRAVFPSPLLNNLLGWASCGLLGTIFINWRTRHNAHHAFSNQIGKDPDLQVPLLATNQSLVASKNRLELLLLPYQAYYYFGLGLLFSFSNRIGGLSYFLRNRSWVDLSRLAAFLPGLFLLFVLPFFLFPLEKAVFVFFLVHLSSGVYLANCFAPNHKAMALVAEDARLSFLEQQVLTSRNVKGGILTDVLLVGLNYQIEHHLFPNCPRNNLKRITPLLRQVCQQTGLTYAETGIIRTNLDILRELSSRGSRDPAPVLD